MVELVLQGPRVGQADRSRRSEGEASVAGLNPDRLYRDHGQALLRYLTRLCGDTDLAGDVLQDTFLRLVERPPRHTDHVKAWLFQVATNRLRDLGRKRSRRDGLMHEEVGKGAHSDPAPSPERTAEQAEARARLRRALAGLSDRDRQILMMREEGFTHREIAPAVGTTTGSVGTLIARALDKVKRGIEEAETPKKAEAP